MSYNTGIENGGVYTATNNEGGVQTVPGYKTLGNYYTAQCPLKSVPGEVPVRCVSISPVYGGVGYKVLQQGAPPSDTGYFTMNNAYFYPSQTEARPFQ
jgi:hypothetical protein